MRNSVPSLLLATVLALGCASAQAQSGRSAPTADCPKGVVTLSLLKPLNNPPFPNMLASWQAANKCIKLDVSELPFGQLADKISVLAAAGNPPDIVVYDGPNTQTYAAAGMLLPLDSYLPPGFKEDLVPATLTEHSYQGKIYSPGTQQTTLAMFYNADMLEPLGIKPPTELGRAWTWAEAMDAFRKCQKESGGEVTVWGLAPSRFGAGTPGFVYRDLIFLRTHGDPNAPKDSSAYKTYWAISPDGKTADGWLNTPEAIAGATFFRDMFNVAKITPKAGIPTSFQDGKACFTLDTSYFIAGLIRGNVPFKWGVTPMPHVKTPIVHTGSLTYGVMTKSKFPDEAAKFVVDVSTGANAVSHANEQRSLPVLKSVAPQMPELKTYPLSIFQEELNAWGHPRPPSPNFAQYDKVVSDALRDIAYGADPKTRLDQAVRTLQPILARQ